MIFIILIILILLLYWYWTLPLSKWEKLNVPHVKPHFLWGNLQDVVTQKKPVFQIYQDIYSKYPNLRYVGIYIINRPGLLIRDPVLIKDITQNNFPSFLNPDFFVDENADPIFAKNPFASRGQPWRERRIVHTKPFSSGKIKYMFKQVDQGGDRMIKFLNDEIGRKEKFTIDAMELSAKYTIYNIGNCALGIDARTFDEDNPEMREMGRKIIEPNFYTGIKQFLIFILPSLSKILSITIVPQDVTEQFKRLTKEQLQYRKDNNIVRNDFFEAVQEQTGNEALFDDMVIQIGGFFIDGYVTSSCFLHFLLYELAVNLDVQRKLTEEIDKFLAKHDGNISYYEFQELQYLEAVIFERLRKYPPLAAITRICTKPFTFPPPNDGGSPLEIQPGTPIVMPIRSLHHDERYFPNPNDFDPNRFLSENKDKIQKGTFLPFGEGPRECIGKRFALVQNKMMVLKILSEFEIRLNPRTKTPVEFDARSILSVAAGGIWLDVYKRKK